MARILIAPGIQPERRPLLQPLLDDGHELVEPTVPMNGLTPLPDVKRELSGIAGTLAGLERYTEEVFAACPDLKVIGRTGVGYDAIDCDAATRHGVRVTTTPGTNHDAVAEFSLALMLAIGRGVVRNDGIVRAQQWGMRPLGTELTRKTIVIVGCGLIGRTLARLVSGFGGRTIGVDPYWDAAWAERQGVERMSLEEALPLADFVSINAPSSGETRHLINDRTLGLMKPTAFLVNTSRGPLIDEMALLRALEGGTIAGAGLDVFELEPLAADSPLRRVGPDKLILTSHIAGVSGESVRAMTEMAVENVRRVLRGDNPLHCVNPAVLG